MGFGLCPGATFQPEMTGAFLPSLSGPAEVVSVSSGAINILHSSRLVVSFVAGPSRMSALSLLLPAFFEGMRTGGRAVTAGDRAAFEWPRVAIGDLEVDAAAGRIWKGSIGPGDVGGLCGWRLSLFREALLQKGKRGGLLGLVGPCEDRGNAFVRKAAPIVERAFFDSRETRTVKGLCRLVGLGAGLTPSGDDLIAGVLLGEKIVRLLPARPRRGPSAGLEPGTCPAVDKKEIREARHRTNDSGRTLLWLALRGSFPAYLIDAVRGIAGAGDLREMSRVVGRAVCHGETSGTDALVGLSLCLTCMPGSVGPSPDLTASTDPRILRLPEEI